jgi:hypothetical protein
MVHPVELSTGDTVYVRALTGEGRQNYFKIVRERDGIPVHLIAALGLCEENGSICFPMSTEKDWIHATNELKDIDGAELQAIALKLIEVSGLGPDAQDKSEKKSEASQSE